MPSPIDARRLLLLEQLVAVVEVSTFLFTGEDLFGQPLVADLESFLDVVQRGHLLVGEVQTVQVEVALDSGFGNGLGDDGGTSLQAPNEEDLLGSLAVGLGNLLQGLVVGEGRVGGSETRVGGDVNALGLTELHQLGRGSVGRKNSISNCESVQKHEIIRTNKGGSPPG